MTKFTKFLKESSLSRIWKHSKSNIPISIITAFRGEYNEQENIKRNKELAAKIKKSGYGYFFLNGYWIENQGTNKEIHVSEKSIFIIGNENDNGKLKGLIKKWIKAYDQDAVIFKPEDEDEFYLINNDMSMIKIGKFTPNKVSQAYSKLRKGRTFVFENIELEKNWLGKLTNLKGGKK